MSNDAINGRRSVSIQTVDGCVVDVPMSIARESGYITQMLDTVRLSDVPLRLLPLEHKACTKVNVERVLLKYMNPVPYKSESDLWEYIQLSQQGEEQRRTATATILESIEIANYLDLEPVIRMLCQCIARAINTMCADTTEIAERFQLQERDSILGIRDSIFNRISPDFWQTHLFSRLSNDKRDMLFASCSASPLNNGMEHWKKNLNLVLVGLPRRLKEIQELTACMKNAIEDADTIAEMWVEEWNDEDSPKTQHLHEIFAKVLHTDFDYDRALDNKKSKYRFGVLESIIECEGNIRSRTDNIEDKAEKIQSAKETIKKGAEEIIGYLEGHKNSGTSLLAQLTTAVTRVFLSNDEEDEEDEQDNSADEEIRSRIAPLIENLRSSSETSEGGGKRQKTRGGRSRTSSFQVARTMLRKDIRTFPEGCVWQLVISASLQRDMDSEPLSDHHRVKDAFEYECSPAGHIHAVLVCTYKVSTEDQVTICLRNFGPKSIVMTVSAASASGGGGGVAEEEEEELKIDEGGVPVPFPRPLSLGHLTEKLWVCRDNKRVEWLRIRLLDSKSIRHTV